jgi:hypothetical protein
MRRFLLALALITFSRQATAAAKIEADNGTPVTFTSTRPDTEIFVAAGDVPDRAYPDPFENVGVAPLTLKLAPGLYTIETVGPTQSTVHETIMVDRWSRSYEVRPGDATVKTVGIVAIATGVVSILAGIIVAVSFGQGDGSFNKFAIAIPLLVAGGGVTLGGVGLSILGTTRLKEQKDKPAPPSAAGLGPTFTVHF